MSAAQFQSNFEGICRGGLKDGEPMVAALDDVKEYTRGIDGKLRFRGSYTWNPPGVWTWSDA